MPDPRVQRLLCELERRARDWEGSYSELIAEVFRREEGLDQEQRASVADGYRAVLAHRRLVDHLTAGLSPRRHPEEQAETRVLLTGILGDQLTREDAALRQPDLDWEALSTVDAALSDVTDPVTRFGIRYALPDWMAGRFIDQYGDEAESLAESLLTPPLRALRVNTLVTRPDDLARELAKDGVRADPSPWSPTGLLVTGAIDLFKHRTFRDGAFEFQDEASQLVAQLVAPPPRGRVLDACAGSGGKSLAVAALMKNGGQVLAVDISEKRLSQLRTRAARARAFNLKWLHSAPEAWSPEVEAFATRAQRILLDAPCSGSGVIRRHPDIKLLRQARDIETLAAQQIALLRGLWPLLRPGGQLLYVTCSVLPTETTQVVTQFCSEQRDACIEPIAAEWGQMAEAGRYILPGSSGMDGFFYARLRKSS